MKSKTRARIALYLTAVVVVVAMLIFLRPEEPVPTWDPALEFEVSILLLRGQHELASAKLATVEDDFPESIRLRLLQAWSADVSGDRTRSRELYEIALDLASSPAERREIVLSIADLHRRDGRLETARGMLSDAVERFGDSPRAERFDKLLIRSERSEDSFSDTSPAVEEKKDETSSGSDHRREAGVPQTVRPSVPNQR